MGSIHTHFGASGETGAVQHFLLVATVYDHRSFVMEASGVVRQARVGGFMAIGTPIRLIDSIIVRGPQIDSGGE
jgi:hypothetical protein